MGQSDLRWRRLMEGIPVYLLLASSFLHDNLQKASAAARLSDSARSLYDLAAERSDLFVQATGAGLCFSRKAFRCNSRRRNGTTLHTPGHTPMDGRET